MRRSGDRQIGRKLQTVDNSLITQTAWREEKREGAVEGEEGEEGVHKVPSTNTTARDTIVDEVGRAMAVGRKAGSQHNTWLWRYWPPALMRPMGWEEEEDDEEEAEEEEEAAEEEAEEEEAEEEAEEEEAEEVEEAAGGEEGASTRHCGGKRNS